MAEPTPPNPITSTRMPATSLPFRSMPGTSPAPLNTSSSRESSGRLSTALHAPAIFAVVVTSSTSDTVVTLCGMVTRAPCTFVVRNSARKNLRVFQRWDADRHHDGIDALGLGPRV